MLGTTCVVSLAQPVSPCILDACIECFNLKKKTLKLRQGYLITLFLCGCNYISLIPFQVIMA